MTKKKRNHPDVEEVLARPWCYYCERDFDDLKILINHQKAKHFKCEKCGRRLNTAGGLSVHMSQVHKESLTSVENALPNRSGLDIEIFGMEGIPAEIVQQHNQRVLTQFHQSEAERRAATGNANQGGAGNNPTKKPKFESPSDLKKRLAEHRAAKAAAEANGDDSGASTPNAASSQPTPSSQPVYVSLSTTSKTQAIDTRLQNTPPAYPAQQATQQQLPYAAPPSTTPYTQNPSPVTYQAPTYGQPVPYVPSPVVPQGYHQPPQPYQQPYGQPPQQGFQQPPFHHPPAFSPPPFQAQQYYSGQPFPPQNGTVPFPGQPVGVNRPFGAGSPPPPFNSQQQRTQSPAHAGIPHRTGSGSLPSAPGLPQRPAVGAPPVNAQQFQQMHQGQIPVPHTHNLPQQPYNPQQNGQASGASPVVTSPPGTLQDVPGASSLDDLISNASKQADANAEATVAIPKEVTSTASVPAPANKEEPTDDKSTKKEKDKAKPTRMVYSDNEISPEEKMAALPKYAFTPSQKPIEA